MRDAFRHRYYEVLASVYLYNEYEGNVGLERLLAAVRQKYPGETEFIAAVEKHTEDERKQSLMLVKIPILFSTFGPRNRRRFQPDRQ